MRNPRHHAILEIYQLVLAAFLFVSPWLFAFAHGTLRTDTWVSAALVAAISLLRSLHSGTGKNGSPASSVFGLQFRRGCSASSTRGRCLSTWPSAS